MKKNMMIYPFGPQTTPIVRYIDMLETVVVQPVASKSWSFCEVDIENFDGGSSQIKSISYDFEDSFDKCDLIYVPYENNILTLKDYKTLIDRIVESEKHAIISHDLEKKLNYNLSNFENIDIYDFDDTEIEFKFEQIVPISIPVILVMGDGINCNKFEIQLTLRKFFQDKGYSVCQFGTKEYSRLFGFKSLPRFIFGSKSLKDKIIRLNYTIYREVMREKADIVIVGVPGGVLPISKEHPGDFGEFAYMITNAVKPDITIRSLYYNNYPSEFFKKDRLMCKYRLNSEVEYYNISNTKLVFPYDRYSELDYLTIKSNNIVNYVTSQNDKTDGYKCFNVLEENNLADAYNQILSQLIGNQVVI
ncbi:TIGR04066 family peptide maturation system protein [Clostridiaceae bacterium M8S5]|nr:TIGR04066 family peptide maturation system protein [Clostridiaceae bacterium M8S5]